MWGENDELVATAQQLTPPAPPSTGWGADDEIVDTRENNPQLREIHAKRLMEARRQDAATAVSGLPAVVREPLHALAGAGASIMSTLTRPFSKEMGDYFAETGKQVDARAEATRKNDWSPWLSRMYGGAVQSLAQSTVAAPAGPAGIIGSFAATEANQALYDAEQAGLKGADRIKYAVVQGAIEGTIAAAFQRFAPGLENFVPQIAKGAMRLSGAQFLKMTAQELPEELLTELGHAITEASYGIDPGATSAEQLVPRMIDTVAQTLGTLGLAQGAARLVQSQQRLEQLQALRTVDSRDLKREAAKLGIEGSRSQIRQKVNEESKQIQKEIKRAQEVQPEAEVRPDEKRTWEQTGQGAAKETPEVPVESVPTRDELDSLLDSELEEPPSRSQETERPVAQDVQAPAAEAIPADEARVEELIKKEGGRTGHKARDKRVEEAARKKATEEAELLQQYPPGTVLMLPTFNRKQEFVVGEDGKLYEHFDGQRGRSMGDNAGAAIRPYAQGGIQVISQPEAAQPASAVTPPTETTAPPAQPAPATDPPVPEGMTRLYHGSGEHGRYTGPAWYSTDRDYAANYRGTDAELQYVDVPTEWAMQQLDPDGYGTPASTLELKNDEFGPRKSLTLTPREKATAGKEPLRPSPIPSDELKAAAEVKRRRDEAKRIKSARKPVPAPQAPIQPPETAPAKEPWQMTRDDYIEQAKEQSGYYNLRGDQQRRWENSDGTGIGQVNREYDAAVESALAAGKDVPLENRPLWALTAQQSAERTGDDVDVNWHRSVVAEAIADGKPVPPEVLADYPDLASEAPTQPQKAAEPTPAPEVVPPPGTQQATAQEPQQPKNKGVKPTVDVVAESPDLQLARKSEAEAESRRQAISDKGLQAGDVVTQPSTGRKGTIQGVSDRGFLSVRWEDGSVLSGVDASGFTKADVTKRTETDNSPPVPDQGITTYGDKTDTYRNSEPEPEAGKDSEPARSPDVQLANTIASALDAGKTLDRGRVDSDAVQAYGGTRAEGAYDPSRSNDALELGVNLHISRADKSRYAAPDADVEGAKQTVEALNKLRESIPSQTTRSGLKDTAQQFSTPPAYAYAVNWIANVSANDTVLEPSAGTGSLAVHAVRSGAKVYVNELKEVGGKPNRRAELLQEIGADQVFTEDAEQIGNVLSGRIQPTVVVMNPPFSTAAGRIQGKKLIGTDLKHIDAALSLLAPDGRLVAIIGAGLHGKSKTLQDWENGLKYDLRADIELNRDVYKGYGTTFPTRVLVIDKRAPTGKTIHGKAETLGDLIDQLKDVRNDRTAATQSKPARAESEGTAAEGAARPRPEPPVRTSTGPVVSGGKETGDSGAAGTKARPPARRPRQPDEQPDAETRPEDVPQPGSPEGGSPAGGRVSTAARKPVPGTTGTEVGGEPVREPVKPESRPEPGTQLDVEAVPAKKRKNELTESVYEAYEPRRVKIKGAKPHPASVVESSAMAAVDPPAITYAPNLPKETVTSGALSEIQLEAIAYAGHAHGQEIEIEGQKYRKGFLIGDGTGIGKGRTAAGIILDNIRQGRTKAVWVSKNYGLLNDSKEYSEAVGLSPDKVFSHNAIKSGVSFEPSDGVLFTTYETMRGIASPKAVAEGNARSRVDQVVEWLGEDFDGAIVFDEAHLMGNAVDTKGGRGVKKASNRALAGLELQRRLPQARIVYMSATAATEVSNLAYAERLGLWGKGTPFANQAEFATEITAGGVAAMEKVAADMKAMGLYTSRNISFNDGTEKGTVDYKRLEHTLTPEETAMYDKMAEAWGVVFSNMNAALQETEGAKDGRAVSASRSAFWGANQRFWNQIITAMQTPAVIKGIEADLKEGRSVVIQLTNTNEAATQRALADMDEEDGYEELDTSPRGILMDFVEKSFPVWQYEEYSDENGNIRSRPALDSQGNRVKSAAAVELQQQLLDQLGSLSVGSRGAIDMVLDHFGTKKVAEITGRTVRIVKGKDGKLEKESRGKSHNAADIKAFQAGQKKILVFSEAGGTGASYHADLSKKNQEKRQHYLLQAGWRADVAIQGLGRTHRSNQAQAPSYVLVHTNLKGQKRFISTIARRLAQLGAITKGQRQAVTGGEESALFTAADNLESTEARQALIRFYEDALANLIPGVSVELLEERLGLKLRDQNGNLLNAMPPITQFLNRVLSLPVVEQNLVFEEFEKRLQEQVELAQSRGELDQGIETVRADKITKLDDRVVYTHESGAETRYVKVNVARKSHPRTWKNLPKNVESYVRSNQTGAIMAVAPTGTFETDTRTGNLLAKAKIYTPTGHTYGYVEKLKNEQYYEQLTTAQAEKAWDAAVAAVPEFTETEQSFLTGVLLPIWNRIPGESTRVLRMMTDAGEMILGRQIPADQVQHTLRALGATADTPDLSPEEAARRVLDRNVELVLANGWSVQRRRVGGENRIELTGPSFVHHGELGAAGVFWERIQSRTRYFIPVDRAGDVLGEVLEGRPITDVVSRSSRDEGEGTASMASPNPTRQTRSYRRKVEGDKAGIAAADIQKTAQRLFGVAIRHGGFSHRAAGIYKWLSGRSGPPSPEVVRTAEGHYASVGVIAHEIAHHIDEKTKAVRSMPKDVRQEIKGLDYEPQKARAFEGWAEFLRRYMTEPSIDLNGKQVPHPALEAPQTLAWFEGTFLLANPEVAKAIAQFREYAQQFAQQTVFQRLGTLIADRQPKDLNFQEEWRAKRRRFANRLKTDFVDKFHTLQWIQERARELGHKGIGIYDLTMAHFLSASSHATTAFEEGVRSIRDGRLLGKTSLWGLREHLKSDSEYEDANLYALARHTLFMAEKKPGYNTVMDIADAEAWLAEVESRGQTERFEVYAQEIARFANDLLKMLVDAGALPAKQAENMLRYYGGGNYFPLYRVREGQLGMFTGTGAGFVNLGKAVRGRSQKGSGRQIIDPIDALVQMGIRFYGRAIQARQQHVLAETLDPKLGGVGGMGGLMDRVDPNRKVTQGTIEEILGVLVEEGVVEADDAKAMRIAARILNPQFGMPSEKEIEWFAERHGIAEQEGVFDEQAIHDAALQEPDALAVISLWRTDYTPNAAKRTVVIYDAQGKPLMYELDPDLHATATGMDELTFGPFMSMFRAAARWFKSGAVGLSTGFGTANLLRDYWQFQGGARHVKGLASLGKPPEMLGRYIAEKARKLAGHTANDPLVRLFEESGGKVYSIIGHDVDSRQRYRRRRMGKSVMSKLGIALEHPGDSAESVLQGMMDLIAVSDAPPRLADMEAAIREEGFEARDGGWYDLNAGKPVDHLPEHVRIKAAMAAAEATINFKRIGALGQYIEAFLPFSNAKVQAQYRQYRQMKSLRSLGKKDAEGLRAARYMIYLSALAATGVAYWLWRHDDDDWREQEAWLRDGYWTWGKNGKTYLKIPKPHDAGIVANLVENMLDAWYHDDARDTSDVVLRDFGGRLPTGGGFIRGFIETFVANYDYFRGRELVPDYLKDLPKEQQITPYTSRASVAIGQVSGRYLGISPIQVEHLLNNVSGGFYHRMTDLYDAASEGRLGPEHIPFLRGLAVDRHQARSVSDFYRQVDDLKVTAQREVADKGKVSDETVQKQGVFESHAELMASLRSMEGKIGKKRNYEYQPYIVGLARAALGYAELPNNPNPLTAKDAPEDVRKLVQDYSQRVVVAATEPLKEKSAYKDEESYEKERRARVRGAAKLKAIGMSYEESARLLQSEYTEDGRLTKGETANLSVRLQKLQQLYGK